MRSLQYILCSIKQFRYLSEMQEELTLLTFDNMSCITTDFFFLWYLVTGRTTYGQIRTCLVVGDTPGGRRHAYPEVAMPLRASNLRKLNTTAAALFTLRHKVNVSCACTFTSIINLGYGGSASLGELFHEELERSFKKV